MDSINTLLTQESLITDLMPEKTYEALDFLCGFFITLLIVRGFCNQHASVQEFLQVPHWTTISRT